MTAIAQRVAPCEPVYSVLLPHGSVCTSRWREHVPSCPHRHGMIVAPVSPLKGSTTQYHVGDDVPPPPPPRLRRQGSRCSRGMLSRAERQCNIRVPAYQARRPYTDKRFIWIDLRAIPKSWFDLYHENHPVEVSIQRNEASPTIHTRNLKYGNLIYDASSVNYSGYTVLPTTNPNAKIVFDFHPDNRLHGPVACIIELQAEHS